MFKLFRTLTGRTSLRCEFPTLTPVFDDPNSVLAAGVNPVLELADQCGLSSLLKENLPIPSANRVLKAHTLIEAMLAGADDSGGLEVLRSDGMKRVMAGCGPVDHRHVPAQDHARGRPATGGGEPGLPAVALAYPLVFADYAFRGGRLVRWRGHLGVQGRFPRASNAFGPAILRAGGQ